MIQIVDSPVAWGQWYEAGGVHRFDAYKGKKKVGSAVVARNDYTDGMPWPVDYSKIDEEKAREIDETYRIEVIQDEAGVAKQLIARAQQWADENGCQILNRDQQINADIN
jgi:hypothetical protein